MTGRQTFARRFGVQLIILLVGSSSVVQAVTPEEIDKSISRAKAFLYSQQNHGTWEPGDAKPPAIGREVPMDPTAWQARTGQAMQGCRYGGLTALATYALLAGGENPQDPRVVEAIKFLKKADLDGTYASGLRAQVWTFLPSSIENKRAVGKDFAYLRDAVKTPQSQPPGDAGFYSYVKENLGANCDLSNSQYGVLGMWAVQETGFEVPLAYWRLVDSAWRKVQLPDGGWEYGTSKQPMMIVPPDQAGTTLSMTTAGIATLFITQEFVRPQTGASWTGNLRDKNIEMGLKWVSDYCAKNKEISDPYTLYGMERIGLASGYKYFGKLNWFEMGANYFIRNQQPDGSWFDGHGGPIAGTAFGILFLVRGRAPVILNKLGYDMPPPMQEMTKLGYSHERPRDAAHFARWMGKQLEQYVNWQLLPADAPLDDLHDSEILYISGNRFIKLDDAQVDKLRQFVQEGGMILANADGGNIGFANAIEKLAKQMFPAYEFRGIPLDHPIYTHQQFLGKKWTTKPRMTGLSNGIRELVVLFPTMDPAKAWQMHTPAIRPELHEVAANVVQYSADKRYLRGKGQHYVVRPDPQIHPERTIRLARIHYVGNWDPEPGGFKRLAAILHNNKQAELVVEEVKLGTKKLVYSREGAGYAVAHLTGTDSIRLSDADRAELKQFMQQGGTLIIDAGGGSTKFTTAMEEELKRMFPQAGDELKSPLPADHPVYQAEEPVHVEFREFARTRGRTGGVPLIRGLKVGDRVAIFFSPEDLSGGLVGNSVDGVVGYEPATALQLMSRMILNSTK